MKLTPFFQVLLLIFVTLGVYYPTLFAPFNLLDDKVFVSQLLNHEQFSLSRYFSPGGDYDYYRPLLLMTFEIDKYVSGLQETFMHLVNITVHLLNVLLVWMVARRFEVFSQRSSQWLPLVAALLFAIHPINTEAVNWIAGRTDLLAGTFTFLALYALLQCLDRQSLPWGGVSAIALFGGALCKETALFLVPGACLLLFYHYGRNRSDWTPRWILPGFYGAAVASYFALRWGAFQTDRGLGNTAKLVSQAVGSVLPATGISPAETLTPFPWFDAATLACKVSGFYAIKLFQPMPLNFAIHQIEDFYLLPGIILVVGLLLLLLRRNLVGWFFLVSASVAVSALVVVFTQLAWTPVAERYMYIPCGPFVIGIVYAVGGRLNFLARQRVATLLVFLLVGAGGWATANRNMVWQDNLTLYEDTVRKSPDFAPARNQLALALKARNRQDEANQILVSNEVSKGDAASLNVAVALMDQGDYFAARSELLQRLPDEQGYRKAQILEMLVRITSKYIEQTGDESLKRLGYQDTVEWLERIKEISPTGFNFYRIGRVYLRLENKDAAQKAFADAAKRLPADSIYKEPAAKLARDLAQ